MTIDEAIKIKSDPKFGSKWPAPKSEIEADRLSVEALKWVKRYRPDNKTDRWSPLLGETEE